MCLKIVLCGLTRIHIHITHLRRQHIQVQLSLTGHWLFTVIPAVNQTPALIVLDGFEPPALIQTRPLFKLRPLFGHIRYVKTLRLRRRPRTGENATVPRHGHLRCRRAPIISAVFANGNRMTSTFILPVRWVTTSTAAVALQAELC